MLYRCVAVGVVFLSAQHFSLLTLKTLDHTTTVRLYRDHPKSTSCLEANLLPSMGFDTSD